MSRRPDPTALTAEEASEVRSLIRRLKVARGLTNEDLADRLGWELHRVTNAMKETAIRRTPNRLLAENANALLQVAIQTPGQPWIVRKPLPTRPLVRKWVLEAELLDFWDRLRSDPESWLNRWKRLTYAPAVFIPPWEAESLAAILTERIKKPGMNRRTVAILRKSLTTELQGAEAAKWAKSWYFTYGPEAQRVVGEVESRKRRWLSRMPSLVGGRSDASELRLTNIPVLEMPPRHFARELVALLVRLTFPSSEEEN